MSTPSEEEARALIDEVRIWANRIDPEERLKGEWYSIRLADALEAALASRLSTPPADAEALARRFHEAYERLAPEFGYKTREASAVPWAEVPEANKRLMIATCASILPDVSVSTPPSDPTREEYREAYETWRAEGQKMHAALLAIWHMAEKEDTAHLTYGDDPQTVVDAVRSALSTPPSEDWEYRTTVAGRDPHPHGRLNRGDVSVAEVQAILAADPRPLILERRPKVEWEPVPAVPVPPTEPATDPWCREESCEHRHWRSGSMPTHKRGASCPAPTEPEGLLPLAPEFEDMLTDDEWLDQRLAAPTEPEEKR